MKRRTLLASAAGGALAGLAGCSTAVGSVAPPTLPESTLEEGGWVRTDDDQRTVFERSFAGITVEAKSHTVVYEDERLRAELAEKTLDRIDTAASAFSATHIDFSADIDDLPGAKGQILDETRTDARRQFEARLESRGIADVERRGTDEIEVATGETADLYGYAGGLEVGELAFDVTDDRTITVDVGVLSVAGDLAVWHADGYVLVAGGVYPAENFATSVDEELSSAIDVRIDVDLGLSPEAYREELRGLITAVR